MRPEACHSIVLVWSCQYFSCSIASKLSAVQRECAWCVSILTVLSSWITDAELDFKLSIWNLEPLTGNKYLETNILHAFWGGGAEVTYYWSDQRGIMVILRRARPPASAPTSNESWLALAGFVSNQLSGGQFNKKKLSSQPARNTACKFPPPPHRFTLSGTLVRKVSLRVLVTNVCLRALLDCQSSRSWGRQTSITLSLLPCGF